MKRVFVCSPLAPTEIHTMEDNQAFARMACKFVQRMGYAPFAPHLFCPQFLDDKSPIQRKIGMQIGMSFLMVCDEIWVFRRTDIEVKSQGMTLEISEAIHAKIKVVEVLDLIESDEMVQGLILNEKNNSWTLFTV